jgi:hypothetical protein
MPAPKPVKSECKPKAHRPCAEQRRRDIGFAVSLQVRSSVAIVAGWRRAVAAQHGTLIALDGRRAVVMRYGTASYTTGHQARGNKNTGQYLHGRSLGSVTARAANRYNIPANQDNIAR